MPEYLFSSATRAAGGLFLFDSGTGKVVRLLEGSYRGLTPGPGGAFYAVSGTHNVREAPDHRCVVYRLEPGRWAAEPVAEFPVGDSHDLRWIGGHFYLVASVGNLILKLDAEGREIGRMQIVEDPDDVCHVNCLTGMDGRLFCSVFTLSPGSRKEKRLTGAWHTEGKVLELDLERRSFSVFYEPLCQPHSLTYHEGYLYLTESYGSCLTRIDPAARAATRLAHYTGFVRGICFGPGENLVGTMRMRDSDRNRRVVPLRRRWLERLRPFAGLMVVDPKTWRVRRRVSLPESGVYDIHLVR
jgi:hypothetical protein